MDPNTDKLQDELEKNQNRAERFVTRNNTYDLLYKDLKGNAHRGGGAGFQGRIRQFGKIVD